MWRYELARSQRLALAAIKLSEKSCKMHGPEIPGIFFVLTGAFCQQKKYMRKINGLLCPEFRGH